MKKDKESVFELIANDYSIFDRSDDHLDFKKDNEIFSLYFDPKSKEYRFSANTLNVLENDIPFPLCKLDKFIGDNKYRVKCDFDYLKRFYSEYSNVSVFDDYYEYQGVRATYNDGVVSFKKVKEHETSNLLSSEEATSVVSKANAKYTICKDDSVPLKRSEPNGNISEVLYKSFYATHTGTGGIFPIDEIHKLCPIKQLRKVTIDGDKYMYAVYQLKRGCIYVFFSDYNYFTQTTGEYRLDDYYYIEQMHDYDAFKSLKKGVSTYDDVLKIDSSKELRTDD